MTSSRLTMNKGRAAVYCRLSHPDEVEVGGVSQSVTTQAANGRRHAELLGYTVGDDDIYWDDGISGLKDSRPGFRKLMLNVFSPEGALASL